MHQAPSLDPEEQLESHRGIYSSIGMVHSLGEMMHQALDIPDELKLRKEPKQQRSRLQVQKILDAAMGICEEQGLAGQIVIYKSTISYHVPVVEDFEAQCKLSGESTFSRFVAGFRKKGMSRICLHANVKSNSHVAVCFKGIYVVHA